MLTKRAFLTALTAATLSATPILAQGGDDPIPGIDIIIKEDPSLVPIKPFSVSKGQMAQINDLKGNDRPAYALKLVAKRLGEGGEFVEMGAKQLGKEWCGPCKMLDSYSVKIPSTAKEGTTYQVTFKIRWD